MRTNMADLLGSNAERTFACRASINACPWKLLPLQHACISHDTIIKSSFLVRQKRTIRLQSIIRDFGKKTSFLGEILLLFSI